MGRLDVNIAVKRPYPENKESKRKQSQTLTIASSSRVDGHLAGSGSQSGGDDDVSDMFMDIELYLAAKSGIFSYFLVVLNRISSTEHASLENILDRVTPAGNTVAHVAAKYGNHDIIHYIAANFSYLIFQKNSDGDSVLHLASRAGNQSIVIGIMPILGELPTSPSKDTYVTAKKTLARKKNKRGNTALHEALENGQELVAQYLIQQDPIVTG